MEVSDIRDPPLPSPFVLNRLGDLRQSFGFQPAALDVAMGDGRHSSVLAAAGFQIFGVDHDYYRVRQASQRLLRAGHRGRLWVADLETALLPDQAFDLVLCTRYLQRTLWSSLGSAVRPGGFLLYETFTTNQRQHSWGPRSPDHLLRPGELRAVFDDWDVIAYEERQAPAAEASLLARRARRPLV